MSVGDICPIATGTAIVFSSRSPDKDRINEDAAVLIPTDAHSGILVVADGAGGLAAGAQASSLAVHVLQTAIEEAENHETGLREAILNGIENASQEIAALGIGAATTIAAVEIRGCTIRPYHVGDSMILIVGRQGKIKLQTVSHSPVGYAVEAGFLDTNEAMHHEERHLVSNMVGSPDMRMEIGAAIDLAARDTLLLATDGLSDNLRAEEIAEYIRKGPLKQAARALAGACHTRMRNPESGRPSKTDDLTFIIFRLAH